MENSETFYLRLLEPKLKLTTDSTFSAIEAFNVPKMSHKWCSLSLSVRVENLKKRNKDKMRSKEIKKLKIQVAKLTNHSRRQSGKLRNKNPTPLTCSAHMTSTRVMQSPQDSTFNSEVMSPTSLTSVLWDSLPPATKKEV